MPVMISLTSAATCAPPVQSTSGLRLAFVFEAGRLETLHMPTCQELAAVLRVCARIGP